MKLIDEGVLQYIIMWGRLDAALCDQLRNLPDAPDLAPAVGYSREQMSDALRHFIGPFRSIDIECYMNSLTPTATRDPAVLVEALERIANVSPMGDHMNGEACVRVARKALAAWKGERDD
jgi:hypothetical protein